VNEKTAGGKRTDGQAGLTFLCPEPVLTNHPFSRQKAQRKRCLRQGGGTRTLSTLVLSGNPVCIGGGGDGGEQAEGGAEEAEGGAAVRRALARAGLELPNLTSLLC
jgi:hypothetical protein